MALMVRRLTWVALWMVIGPAAVHAAPRLFATAEVGPELDTNAHRIQPIFVKVKEGENTVGEYTTAEDDPVRAGLLRVTASGRLIWQLGSRHMLSAAYGGGGKVFFSDDARSADELVHEGSLGWGVQLPPGVLSLEGSFYDGYQRTSERDFRTGTGLVRLAIGQRVGGLAAAVAAGYRGLQYKPAADYSFHGPVAGVDLSSALTSGPADELVEWNLSLSYWLGHRQFEGEAGVLTGTSDTPREDLIHLLRAEVNYLGNADASLWYSVEVNQSNSYAEGFIRHTIGLKFTSRLVWGLYLTAKGAVQLSWFRDPGVVSTDFLAVEDENRTRLVLQLARDLTPALSVLVRYGLYVNESVTPVDLPYPAEVEVEIEAIPAYLRQTLFVGLRLELGR
jgi:hypothetical protein